MGISLLAISNILKTAAANADFVGAAGGSYYQTVLAEANAQIVFGVAGTVGGSGAPTTVNANATGTSRSVKSRLNGANGNILVSPTNTTAGYYQDTTHSDTIAQADKYCFEFLSTGTPTYPFLTTGFVATSNHAAVYQTSVSAAKTTTAAAFQSLAGGLLASSTTEADKQVVIRQAGTAQYLFCYVSANAGTTATITSRKNTAAGGMSISVGSGATGMFTDTTHTDTLASGDLFCYSIAQGATTSVTYQSVGCTIVNTAGNNTSDIAFGGTATSPLVSSTQHFAPIAGYAGSATGYSLTEADAQIRHGFGVTVTRLRINVSQNVNGTTSTVVSRKNGADGALTFTIGASATGQFEDTTHTDTLVAADDYCWAITTPSGSNFRMLAGAVTEQAASTTGTVSLVGAAVTASAGTVQPTASIALTGVSATSATTALAITESKTLSGAAATAAAGIIVPQVATALIGAAATSAAGAIFASTKPPLTGASATASAGTISLVEQKTLLGAAATSTAGTIAVRPSAVLSGQQITMSAGVLGRSIAFTLHGIQSSAQAGAMSALVAKAISGNALTASAGILAAARALPLFGAGMTATAGIIIVMVPRTLLYKTRRDAPLLSGTARGLPILYKTRTHDPTLDKPS